MERGRRAELIFPTETASSFISKEVGKVLNRVKIKESLAREEEDKTERQDDTINYIIK